MNDKLKTNQYEYISLETEDKNIEQLNALIVQLSNKLADRESELYFLRAGMTQHFKDNMRYKNQMYFRDLQIKKAKRIFAKIYKLGYRVQKKVPKKKRGTTLKYLKKIKEIYKEWLA